MAFSIGSYHSNPMHIHQPKLSHFSLSTKNFGASSFMPNLFRVDRPIKDPKPKLAQPPVSIQGNPLNFRKRFPGTGMITKSERTGFPKKK